MCFHVGDPEPCAVEARRHVLQKVRLHTDYFGVLIRRVWMDSIVDCLTAFSFHSPLQAIDTVQVT